MELYHLTEYPPTKPRVYFLTSPKPSVSLFLRHYRRGPIGSPPMRKAVDQRPRRGSSFMQPPGAPLPQEAAPPKGHNRRAKRRDGSPAHQKKKSPGPPAAAAIPASAAVPRRDSRGFGHANSRLPARRAPGARRKETG